LNKAAALKYNDMIMGSVSDSDNDDDSSTDFEKNKPIILTEEMISMFYKGLNDYEFSNSTDYDSD